MILTRKKKKDFPGYQKESTQQNIDLDRVGKLRDDLIYTIADVADTGLDYAADSNPIVEKATSKLRKRISGYTVPIKKLIALKRKKEKDK